MSSPIFTRKPAQEKAKQAIPAPRSARSGFPVVGVRLLFDDQLELLEVFPDGVAFRSPAPLAGGKKLELVLCGGTLLVDAVVARCDLHDGGQFIVRVRYHQLSEALQVLVTREVRQTMIPAETAPAQTARKQA